MGLHNQHHRSRGPAWSPGFGQGPVSCLGGQGPCRCAQDADSPKVPVAGITVRRVSREMGPASPLSHSPGADRVAGDCGPQPQASLFRCGAAEGSLPGTGSAGPGGGAEAGVRLGCGCHLGCFRTPQPPSRDSCDLSCPFPIPRPAAVTLPLAGLSWWHEGRGCRSRGATAEQSA